MNWEYKIFGSSLTGSFSSEIDNCLLQFSKFVSELTQDIVITRLNIYLASKSFSDFLAKKDILIQKLSSAKQSEFIIEVIPQKPIDKKVEMKAMYFDNSLSGYQFTYSNIEDFQSLKFQNKSTTFLLTSISSFSGDIENDSQTCFQKTALELKSCNLGFSDTLRQWNYIGGILEENVSGEKLNQNYQKFNDVRSDYYALEKFLNGYPAATGIGIDYEGLILQTFSGKFDNSIGIKKIDNPQQTSAHEYSKDVLVGKLCNHVKTTPKFERAKAVFDNNNGWVFVSGTAAIKGEKNILEDSVETQTIETLKLIEKLISFENLKAQGVDPDFKKLIPKTYRAYVKYENDLEKVKSICEKYFTGISGVFLIADVCRGSLLVEIEGEFKLEL